MTERNPARVVIRSDEGVDLVEFWAPGCRLSVYVDNADGDGLSPRGYVPFRVSEAQ